MVRLRNLLALLACAACGNGGSSPDAGSDAAADVPPPAWCTYIDAGTCESPTPSYSAQIVPMLDRACNTTCHAPGVGPWPLTDYQDVSDWASIIQNDIQACSMPPPDAGAGNGNLSDTDRATLLDWLACGAPNN